MKNLKKLAEEERKKSKGRCQFAKIFVCDRAKAQSNAITTVFPNAKIIYCKYHLLKDIDRNCSSNSTLYYYAQKMLSTRKNNFEMKFKQELEKFQDCPFKTQLINDMKHYLPSIVDKYYHRNNLTSNLAESSFSVLKRMTQWTKQPITTSIEIMARRSKVFLVNSINKRINVPISLLNRVDEKIGYWALEYLKKELDNDASVQSEECKCCFETTQLPCKHWLVNNQTKKIKIPIEYERIKCDLLTKTNNEIFDCNVSEIDFEEEELDLRDVVNQLYEKEGTLRIRNQMAYMGLTFLKYRKYLWKITPSRINYHPGMIKFSKNCDLYKKRFSKRQVLNLKSLNRRKTLKKSFK